MRNTLTLLLALIFCSSLYATEYRLLAYNVWGLPSPFTTNPARFIKIRDELSNVKEDYDIISFEETFSSNTRILANMPQYPYHVYGGGGRFLKINSGLLLVSKWPIIESHFMPFYACNGTDCFANKGVLHARILLNNREVDVFTTHLNAGNSPRNEQVRYLQLRQIVSFVKKMTNNSRPYFFLGDFNIHDDNDVYYFLTKALEVNDSYKVRVGQMPFIKDNEVDFKYTYDPLKNPNISDRKGERERLDYIFYKGTQNESIDVRELSLAFSTNGNFLSDHFGLEGTFYLQDI